MLMILWVFMCAAYMHGCMHIKARCTSLHPIVQGIMLVGMFSIPAIISQFLTLG